MASFVKIVCFVVNYAIFHELCDRMRFAVDCAKSHHRVISEGLNSGKVITFPIPRHPLLQDEVQHVVVEPTSFKLT